MAEIERVQENGLRFYQVTEGGEVIAKLPSVTTVLGQTKDMSGLAKWRKRVGEKEADRISNLSMSRVACLQCDVFLACELILHL